MGARNPIRALKSRVIRSNARFAAFARLLPLIPPAPFLSRVDFLGEISDFLPSGALLPLIPPAPFSHTGRRGSLGVLMPETGDVTQELPKKPTPVSYPLLPQGAKGEFGHPDA